MLDVRRDELFPTSAIEPHKKILRALAQPLASAIHHCASLSITRQQTRTPLL
jgi:hypothetical protein